MLSIYHQRPLAHRTVRRSSNKQPVQSLEHVLTLGFAFASLSLSQSAQRRTPSSIAMAGPGIHPYHHQPWGPPHPHGHHPPPPVAPPPPLAVENPPRPALDEVRTIFISGLPADVKERELHNLLRWLPGFEAAQVNFKSEQPMGFALFSTAHHAMAAKGMLQDLVFDADAKSTLHIEMAKKNLFVKRTVGTDPSLLDPSKRLRTVGDYTPAAYPGPPFHPSPPPPPVWGAASYLPPPAPYNPYGGYPVSPVAVQPPPAVTSPAGYAPVQNTKDNAPCNTLFIGNLGENVIEEELRGLFSVQPGYKQMKVLRQERSTVCFIEFEDVVSASQVHQNLQGAVIPSSGRGGMRIQFSKNPFGRRKDSANNGGANGSPVP
ncbi:hypothetical protein LUZ61_002137 [Rhynchospora tenuis]|uniref:RRM domain-containing protein n=1 Tax=Rhynchospora tenuis TaxID=198213 RepID=A0AAD5ZIB1_9POAL|nr:hypothetical protein LUZ61_002137 [Rhynchospora tenuis]